MIDLHMHTNCSDGANDVNKVLQMAAELQLTHISVTDHNNCNAYFQIDDTKHNFNGKIIRGIEPECYYMGRCIELLGYGIDPVKMRELLKGVYRNNDEIVAEQYKRFYNNLVAGGVKFSAGIFEKWDRSKHYYGGGHLHADLTKYPENKKIITDEESWNNSIQFYRKWGSNSNSPFAVGEDDFYPTAELIYSLIKKAGGKVFIPHIFLYGEDSMDILNGLIKDFQIDGIECYYPAFSKEQTDFLLDYCKKNNLLVSAGSDFHGDGPAHPQPMGTTVSADRISWLK